MTQNRPKGHEAEVTDKMESLCLAKLWTDPRRLSGFRSQPVPPERGKRAHLEHRQECLRKVVKGASLGLSLVKIKLPTKQLHPQQGEDDDEEEEE
jgi:hypothetical protein